MNTPAIHSRGWVGFDLDGTLARHDKWLGVEHIGEPIEPMMERVRYLLKQGRVVKIFTARVNPNNLDQANADRARAAIEAWCEKHFGFRLEVTCSKDMAMTALFDDRAISVELNTGRILTEGVV